MKAIRVHAWGGPEVLRYDDVDDPTPGPGQVVVRVRAVGVNPVETYIRSGAYGTDRPLPFILGTDAAGDVESVGPDVFRWKPGDRVYNAHFLNGAYAERVACGENDVAPLPDGLTYAQGAAVYVPYFTAWRALFQRGGARPGETVLVHGATGGVGVAAVQMARASGLTVIGTGGTEKGRTLARAQGAHHVLDHHAEGYLQQVMDLSGGRGVDVVLEMLANVNLGNDLGILASYGRVVIVGSRGPVEINPRDTMGRNADIRGMRLFDVPPDDLRVVRAAVHAGLENGLYVPQVAEEIPLADAARAHEAILRPGHAGKIVLTA